MKSTFKKILQKEGIPYIETKDGLRFKLLPTNKRKKRMEAKTCEVVGSKRKAVCCCSGRQ